MTNKYKAKIEVKFRAGHRLISPYEGKCNHPHGEGYTAIFEFEVDKLNENDMVEDFGYLKRICKEWIDLYVDHSFICNKKDMIMINFLEKNKFKFCKIDGNPTAEKMAEVFYHSLYPLLPNLKRVGIVESFEDSIAYYEGELI